MGRYLGKRLISTIPLLLVISFVVFMFIHMIPGDLPTQFILCSPAALIYSIRAFLSMSFRK